MLFRTRGPSNGHRIRSNRRYYRLAHGPAQGKLYEHRHTSGFVAFAGLFAAALSRTAATQQTEESSGQDRSRAARATSRATDLTDAELEAMFQRCSNLGRWGADDELGTLNYVTAAKRIAAAQLVKTGEVVSIGRDISKTASKVDPHPVQLMVTYGNDPASATTSPWRRTA